MATDKNFIVKNGLEVGGQEVISSSGVVTSAALGGQTLSSTDSPTFNNLTLTNDIAIGGDLNLTGDLNITGDINSLSVTDLDVTDKTITLGAGQVESASGGSGIVIDGSSASILWDETNDEWDFNKGIDVTGVITADGLTLGINEYIQMGGAGEFQIFNDGSNTVLRSSDNLLIQRNTTPRSAISITDSSGEVQLHYGGSEKLATTSTGIVITGTVTSDGLTVDTSTLVVDATNNRVGIGTSNPLAPLDVVRGGTTGLSSVNARTALLVQNNLASGTVLSINAKNTGYSGIFLGDQDSEAICQIQYVHTDDKLKFLTNGGGYTPLTISGTSVGVQETSPDAYLHITGKASYTTANSSEVSGLGFVRFQPNSSSEHSLWFHNAGNNLGISGYTDASTSVTRDMTLQTYGGNVGIGTDSPATSLDVNGTLQLRASGQTTYATRMYSRLDSTHTSVIESYVNSNSPFEMMGSYADSAGVNPRIVIASGGQKVGIGTTSPSQTLHVDSSSGAVIRVSRIATSAGAYGQLEHDGTDTTLTSTGATKFYNNSNYSLTINSSGKVAIGTTTSPQANLAVRDRDDNTHKGGRIGFGIHEAGSLQMYHATNMSSTAGSVVTDSTSSGGDNHTLSSGQLYGPYITLPRGQYRLCVKMKTTDASYTGDAARIFVYGPTGTVVTENRTIKGTDFDSNDKWETFSVPFQIVGTTNSNIEYYAFALNSQQISVDYFFVMNDTDSHSVKVYGNHTVDKDLIAANAKLKAIAESNTDTAVDVFVYDTRKDSDGGAWRKRTQHTSWYNETLNQSHRGVRKEFPCVAVIVAEATQLTIYDGDDPDMPMWMIFNSSGANGAAMLGRSTETTTSIAMLNGLLSVGRTSFGLHLVNFISDSAVFKEAGYDTPYSEPIVNRNSGNSWVTVNRGNDLINDTINDVAMKVLPNAPIDADTGLPVPTIALATGGGVSVIKDDGTVVDITSANGWMNSGYLTFDQDNYIISQVGNATGQGLMFRYPIPSADRTVSAGDRTVMLGGGNIYNGETPHFGNNLGGLSKIAHDESGFAVNSKNNGYNQLVKYWKNNNTDYTKSAVAYISTDYNTGWMPGDMRLSTLSATSTVDNTDYVGGEGTFSNASNWSADSQWTVSGGTASYSGSGPAYISRTPTSNFVYGKWYYAELDVTAGSAGTLLLVNRHISGIVKPYTSGLTNVDVGFIQLSGTKYFAMWQQNSNNQSSISVYATSAVTIDNFKVYEMPAHDRTHENNHFIKYGTIDSAAVATGAELISYSTTGSIGNGNTDYLFQPYTADLDFGTGDFSTINWYRQDSSLSDWTQMYQRGDEQYLTLRTHPSSNSTYDGKILFKAGNASWAITDYNTIGKGWICIVITRSSGVTKMYVNGKHEYTTTSHNGTVNSGSGLSINPGGGKVALLRMTASALNEETIKKIYEDEKHLFATNAKATLYGSSESVTAFAYDDDTELLHVGTNSGRSVFQGLNRVDNTTDGVTAAISASNELVVEE